MIYRAIYRAETTGGITTVAKFEFDATNDDKAEEIAHDVGRAYWCALERLYHGSTVWLHQFERIVESAVCREEASIPLTLKRPLALHSVHH